MREGTPIEDKREACINYFRLLGALEMRFASSELRINFIWRDAFQKVVRMGEADMRYESAAILFNLAAETSLPASRSRARSPRASSPLATSSSRRRASSTFNLTHGQHELGRALDRRPLAARVAHDTHAHARAGAAVLL